MYSLDESYYGLNNPHIVCWKGVVMFFFLKTLGDGCPLSWTELQLKWQKLSFKRGKPSAGPILCQGRQYSMSELFNHCSGKNYVPSRLVRVGSKKWQSNILNLSCCSIYGWLKSNIVYSLLDFGVFVRWQSLTALICFVQEWVYIVVGKSGARIILSE